MRRPLLVLIPAMLIGCSAELDSKLGAEGERCLADNDCHIDLICNRGLCLLPGDAEPEGQPEGQPEFQPDDEPEPDFRPDPDPNPPPDVQPEPVPLPLEEICKELCDHLLECGFDQGGDACIENCVRELRGFEDGAECLLSLNCEELSNGSAEACFEVDGGGGNNGGDAEINRCFEVCEFVTTCDEFIERCGEQVAFDTFEQCSNACFDEGARSQILQADGLSCEVVVPLAIDGFGLRDVCER